MSPGSASSSSSVLAYFKREKKYLVLTAITGTVYNVGMTAGPWFEGQLAQYLYDIIGGTRAAIDIVELSLVYVAVIALVQGMRALKRLYVRKFANDVSRSMREDIFRHLLREPLSEAKAEDAGAMMTRAIADADSTAEGMRKFTTEVFDTGVVMVAYLVMLLVLDWRLALIVIAFPPIAYIVAAFLRKKVTASTAAARKAMSRLNNAAVDAAANALTYRIYGEDGNRAEAYEDALSDYEGKNVRAGIWQNSPEPVYLAISMIGVMPILFFGGANVLGTGWGLWSIATFSSFLSCFLKLATKSSHAAKLFNAVQKAQVSWRRIEGYLADGAEGEWRALPAAAPARLEVEHVSFAYGEAGACGDGETAAFALHDLNLAADPGEIVGITGKVASGKSSFGKLFLDERSFEGRIRYGGRDIRDLHEPVFAYAGHDPELFTGTVRENVAFAQRGEADEERLAHVLAEVQIDGEVGPDTRVGMEGNGLSGGQRSRIALARALYSRSPVLVLDDPFASVDRQTERLVFEALRAEESWRTILVISHRMALFPAMGQVALIEDGTMQTGTHERLMEDARYRELFELQAGEELKTAPDGERP